MSSRPEEPKAREPADRKLSGAKRPAEVTLATRNRSETVDRQQKGGGGHADLADLCRFVVYKQNQHGG